MLSSAHVSIKKKVLFPKLSISFLKYQEEPINI